MVVIAIVLVQGNMIHANKVKSIVFPLGTDHCLKKCNEYWQASVTGCGPRLDICIECSVQAESCRAECFTTKPNLRLRTTRNIIVNEEGDTTNLGRHKSGQFDILPVNTKPIITLQDDLEIETDPQTSILI